MNKLNTGHRHLLKLVAQDPGPDGWTPVSAAVFPLISAIPGNFVELERVGDLGKGRARLTQKGSDLMEAMERL